MLHQEHRAKLKKIIGHHYTKDVLKILKEKRITNSKGNFHGRSMIRNVFNGINENQDIENAIWELFINKLDKNEKIEALRNELLALTDI